jgi:hypothetical protein
LLRLFLRGFGCGFVNEYGIVINKAYEAIGMTGDFVGVFRNDDYPALQILFGLSDNFRFRELMAVVLLIGRV